MTIDPRRFCWKWLLLWTSIGWCVRATPHFWSIESHCWIPMSLVDGTWYLMMLTVVDK